MYSIKIVLALVLSLHIYPLFAQSITFFSPDPSPDSYLVFPIQIGERHTVPSKILGETRMCSIYLPESYHKNPQYAYPVLYIMDGDYNFHHITGVVEQLSSISKRIPELIVVGISDKGHQSYVKNTTPLDKTNNPEGQSEKFLKFIEKELKLYIESHYRTNSYDLLFGHSLGGLFTINTLLNSPKAFEAYIAVSPSLWWDNYSIEKKVEDFYKKYDNLNKTLFLTLGNEKGMGVYGFYNQLDKGKFADEYLKNKPLGLDYTFKVYPDENHNTVGLVSVNQGLKTIFSTYELSDYTEFKSLDQIQKRIKTLEDKYGKELMLPSTEIAHWVCILSESEQNTLGRTFPHLKPEIQHQRGLLQQKNKDVKNAILTLEKLVKSNPNTPEFMVSLAKVYLENKEEGKAKEMFHKAYDLAIKLESREWYLNELESYLK